MAPALVDECRELRTVHRMRESLDPGVPPRVKMCRVSFADTCHRQQFPIESNQLGILESVVVGIANRCSGPEAYGAEQTGEHRTSGPADSKNHYVAWRRWRDGFRTHRRSRQGLDCQSCLHLASSNRFERKAGAFSRACTEARALADRELKRLAAVCFSGVKMLGTFNRPSEGDAPSFSTRCGRRSTFCFARY